MNRINSHTSWQPLEEVIVGRVYTPEYFDDIKDHGVRAQLSRILDETNEDLDTLSQTLKDYGAVVHRPDLPDLEWTRRWKEQGNDIPLPPLNPRDWQITFGNKLLRLLHVSELDTICESLESDSPGSVIDPHAQGFVEGHPLNGAQASCIVRVGADVFFDNSEWLTTEHMHWIRDNVLDSRYRVRRAVTHGHGDSVFAILKPGVIISSMHDADLNYREDFPGWEVFRVMDASINACLEVGKFKYENFNGRWYVQGQDPTPEFRNFVDTYLTKWTGLVQETVFDVNCLVLDEHNVIFSAYNESVFRYCERHGITPIICDLRHRYFFDGGISCVTQDIRRRGGLETYL